MSIPDLDTTSPGQSASSDGSASVVAPCRLSACEMGASLCLLSERQIEEDTKPVRPYTLPLPLLP